MLDEAISETQRQHRAGPGVRRGIHLGPPDPITEQQETAVDAARWIHPLVDQALGGRDPLICGSPSGEAGRTQKHNGPVRLAERGIRLRR